MPVRAYLPDIRLAADVFCYAVPAVDHPDYAHYRPNSLIVADRPGAVTIDGERWDGSLLYAVVPERAVTARLFNQPFLLIDLAPGSLARLFGIDAGAARVPFTRADTDRHPAFARLHALVRTIGCNPDRLVPALDALLLDLAAQAVADEPVEAARRLLVNSPLGSLRVPEVAERVGLSQRTLERRFKRRFGTSISRYLRLVRYLRTVLGPKDGLPSWRDLPGADRYADQSHFLRESRELTGELPSAIRAEAERFPWHFYARGQFDGDGQRGLPLEHPDWRDHMRAHFAATGTLFLNDGSELR